MTKHTFLALLRKGLSGLPEKEIEEQLTFYSEMIDDRMEEGLSEEDAVSAVGDLDEILSQVAPEPPAQPQPKRKAWETVLLVLGCPIWASLLVAAFGVIVSLYAVLWSVVVTLWSLFASLIGCAVGGIVAGILFCCSGHSLSGIAMLGAGIVCFGLSVFLFFGCKGVTGGICRLTKKVAVWIRNRFTRKEDAK